MSLLDKIKQTGDIRKIPPDSYDELASEIREFLLEKVSEHGGHLASNLGSVELTMALHLAFDPEYDRIDWDVGHQAYTHKLLTGRREGFDSLREFGGMSGFPKRKESRADVFDSGHASSSISEALGLVRARDLTGGTHHVVAVIGDGSMGGGMAFEALNTCSGIPSNFVIVLNDNHMSISPSKGGLSAHLARIRVDKGYNDLKEDVVRTLDTLPNGDLIIRRIRKAKGNLKEIMFGSSVFDSLGVTYIGPIDGHDVKLMAHVFRRAKNIEHPVLIHVVTKKGLGYAPAMRRPDRFHGIGRFDPASGTALSRPVRTYTDVFSQWICRAAETDMKIAAVTAAMEDGTGLRRFQKRWPERFFDVGIAEEHAVSFAAGLAAGGIRPVAAVYSTFLQRAYDQILMDVCLQKLPVIFAVDRAGLAGADGQTHQGAFDLSYLSGMPDMTVIAPGCVQEMRSAFDLALSFTEGPVAVRYPRAEAWSGPSVCRAPMEYGRSLTVRQGKDITLIAVGSMLRTALDSADLLKSRGFDITVINARFVKPLDTDMLDRAVSSHSLIVTLEDNVLAGGYGSSCDTYLSGKHPECAVLNLALPDRFIEQGSRDELFHMLGLDAESVADRITDAFFASGSKDR